MGGSKPLSSAQVLFPCSTMTLGRGLGQGLPLLLLEFQDPQPLADSELKGRTPQGL